MDLFSSIVADTSSVTGALLNSVTVIDTVDASLFNSPSFAKYVKLSLPK